MYNIYIYMCVYIYAFGGAQAQQVAYKLTVSLAGKRKRNGRSLRKRERAGCGGEKRPKTAAMAASNGHEQFSK